MAQIERMWDWTARRYAKTPIADQETYERKLNETKALLTPDAEVFEFGCGTGSTALWHAPHVKRIEATDGSAKMIEICREKAEAAGISNVTFRHELATEYFGMDKFDAVFAFSILHLLRDRVGALATVERILKPGGRFFSSTMCIKDAGRFMRMVAPVIRIAPIMPYVASFTETQLKAEIEDAGLVIERSWKPKPGAATFIIAQKPQNPIVI